ncbi:MAG TPA: ComF family protein [Actinomycetota bacterium]|jgi:predicted amidophosphoribosyltransferase|nr:ComF family protein [Actinomycetota bacterium]
MAAVHAAWSYEGPGRAVVLALKERGRRGCADPLAAAAAQAVWREGSAADALTFVPARRDDVRRRGFDHGALLAREVGRRLGLEVLPLLSRARPVDDQVGLSATARRENLRGAFISAPAPARIALVDDVVTTGATAAACAAALRRAGTRRVELIVACRTPATY